MKVLIGASLAASLVNFRGDLIRDLLALGVGVHVLAPDITRDVPTRRLLEEWGVTVHSIRMSRNGRNPIDDILTLISFRTLFVRIRPDVYFGYTAKPVIYGLLASAFASVPRRVAMITGLGYGFQDGYRRMIFRVFMTVLYRAALARASAVIFQNPDDRQFFKDRGLLRESVRTEVVNGSGVNLSRFRDRPLPAGPIKFLMIARLIGDKGVREYIEAAKKIAQHDKTIRFQLVGPRDFGPNAISPGELRRWIDERVVEYLGELKDVRDALADCSVYVLPSYREGTPRSVLEAMATGRPIITTDVPGCRQTVDEGINGLLVEPHSADALAAAMRKFVSNPELIPVMALASLNKVRDNFDVREVNRKILEVMFSDISDRAFMTRLITKVRQRGDFI
jgi:glycosyltransferase involved in cell wall biosynthesis